MSTYIDMLRAQRAKREASGQQTPPNREPAPGISDAGLQEESALSPDSASAPLADELSDTGQQTPQQQPAPSGTHIDMLRAQQARNEADDAEPLPPEIADAELQEESAQPASDSTEGENFGPVSHLAEETPDQPLLPEMTMQETNNNTQAAWLSECTATLLRIYEDAGHNKASDLSPLLMHLDRFTESVYTDSERLNGLELEISNHIDEFRDRHATIGDLLEKAVMMMLYGIKVCMQMHMEPAEITRYTAASMLHNIGMALILVDTRLKESTLSDVERALIRKTPGKSLEYLKQCGVTDPVLLLAAQQAQERYDGSGPLGLSGSNIALSARIVGLLSMFEALVHVRTYRERLLPRDAIRKLVNKYKDAFDPSILKALIESVSLYPVGTYVQLNSGEVGQVIRVQPRLPLRPRVYLTMDRHGNRIQPREVDLREQPNLMVQRCMNAAGLATLKQAEENV
jgi:HD-GYP domain-containing protein (c-di-GMP phosphodiesterase class II)